MKKENKMKVAVTVFLLLVGVFTYKLFSGDEVVGPEPIKVTAPTLVIPVGK